MSLDTKAFAVALSVLRGVRGCGCPRAVKTWRIGMAVCALWKRALVSASAELATTCQIVRQSVKMGPLGAGLCELLWGYILLYSVIVLFLKVMVNASKEKEKAFGFDATHNT